MDNSPPLPTVASNVVAAMEAKGVSQKALAEATGIPRVTLIRRLQAVNSFTVAELAAIAEHLGTTVVDLIAEPTEQVTA